MAVGSSVNEAAARLAGPRYAIYQSHQDTRNRGFAHNHGAGDRDAAAVGRMDARTIPAGETVGLEQRRKLLCECVAYRFARQLGVSLTAVVSAFVSRKLGDLP